MPTTIKVSIARLGTSIQEVEVETGSNVMAALRKANYDLDAVVSAKRNGAVVQMDTVLAGGDVILVSMEKIKGGADEVEVEPTPIRLSFRIERENAVKPSNQMLFTDDMTTFDIVKQVMRSRGVSLNSFKEIKDEDGTVLTFADKLEDGKAYKIITCEHSNCEESDDNDDY